MEQFFRSAHEHGVWEFIHVLLVASGFVVGLLWWPLPRKYIPGLNFHLSKIRDNSDYPLKVNVEIRNFTGRSVVLYSAGLKLHSLHPHPEARGDTPSGVLEIKFPKNSPGGLEVVEYLLRPGDKVGTWIPLDPSLGGGEV